MKYFLATYEILDGEHEHRGAVIFEAETAEEAYKMADAEEHSPDTVYTDNEWDEQQFKYFDFGGDGTTAAKNRGCREITKEQVQFLEEVGLAYRK